jgi:hypothetical protein
MFQHAAGYITCRECNASYESETKLYEHQRMSHRASGTEERPQATTAVMQTEDPCPRIARWGEFGELPSARAIPPK